MNIIGIDPGLKGAIALLGSGSWKCWPIPTRHGGIDWLAVRRIIRETLPASAFIEKVQPFPGVSAASQATSLINYGRFLEALSCADVSANEVPSKTWQKVMLAGQHLPPTAPRGSTAKQRTTANAARRKAIKQNSCERARQLFPGFDGDDNAADALLIAEYGRRTGGYNA